MSFTVTFDSSGGSAIDPITEIIPNSTISKPSPDPTNGTYNFGGWYTGQDYITSWNFDVDIVTESFTLYAKWTCTVTFDPNGGSAVDEQIIQPGLPALLPSEPTRSGVVFSGWYKEASFNTLWNFNDVINDNPTIIYAKWTCTVSFFTSEGTILEPVEVTADIVELVAPIPPTNYPFYEFVDWYKEPNYTTSWNFDVDTFTEHTKLYAKWNLLESVTKVKFSI